jgi:hypothetical protein
MVYGLLPVFYNTARSYPGISSYPIKLTFSHPQLDSPWCAVPKTRTACGLHAGVSCPHFAIPIELRLRSAIQPKRTAQSVSDSDHPHLTAL